jgi:hypothetical protein
MKRKNKKRITVRVAHRSEPDIRKLSRALIDLATAQAEADAQAAHRATGTAAADAARQAKGGPA